MGEDSVGGVVEGGGGEEVIVLGEEDVLVSCPSSMPYVEVAEESLEMAF